MWSVAPCVQCTLYIYFSTKTMKLFHSPCGPCHREGEDEIQELIRRTESLPISRFDIMDGDEIYIDGMSVNYTPWQQICRVEVLISVWYWPRSFPHTKSTSFYWLCFSNTSNLPMTLWEFLLICSLKVKIKVQVIGSAFVSFTPMSLMNNT